MRRRATRRSTVAARPGHGVGRPESLAHADTGRRAVPGTWHECRPRPIRTSRSGPRREKSMRSANRNRARAARAGEARWGRRRRRGRLVDVRGPARRRRLRGLRSPERQGLHDDRRWQLRLLGHRRRGVRGRQPRLDGGTLRHRRSRSQRDELPLRPRLLQGRRAQRPLGLHGARLHARLGGAGSRPLPLRRRRRTRRQRREPECDAREHRRHALGRLRRQPDGPADRLLRLSRRGQVQRLAAVRVHLAVPALGHGRAARPDADQLRHDRQLERRRLVPRRERQQRRRRGRAADLRELLRLLGQKNTMYGPFMASGGQAQALYNSLD